MKRSPTAVSLMRFALALSPAVLAWNLITSVTAYGVGKVTPAQAKDYVGQISTVCGVVVSARYAERVKGSPTFLNLDKPYPNQIFTVVIWGNDRQKFGEPEMTFKNKRICVTGKIQQYKDVPEIVVKDKSQISDDR